MAPRIRRKVEEEIIPETDTLQDAMTAADDEATPFDELKDFFVQLNQRSGNEALVIVVMTREHSSKPWSTIDQIRLESVSDFDPDEAIDNVWREHGDGEYKFMVRIRGRVVKHLEFRVGDPRKKHRGREEQPAAQNNDLMLMLFKQQADASERQSRETQAASDRAMQMQATMMQGMMTMIAAIIPAVSGNKTDPSEMMKNLASTMRDMNPPREGGSLKEMIETVVAVKDLVGGGSDKETSLLDIAKDALPAALSAIGPMLEARKTNAPQTQPLPVARTAIPHTPAPIQPADVIPGSENPSEIHPPEAREAAPLEVPADPLLALIGPDILFFAMRNYPPTLAADTLADKLLENGYDLPSLTVKVTQLFGDGDWLEALAAHGVDLRPYRAWAEEVLPLVIEAVGGDDDAGGNGADIVGDEGRATDPAHDEGASPPG